MNKFDAFAEAIRISGEVIWRRKKLVKRKIKINVIKIVHKKSVKMTSSAGQKGLINLDHTKYTALIVICLVFISGVASKVRFSQKNIWCIFSTCRISSKKEKRMVKLKYLCQKIWIGYSYGLLEYGRIRRISKVSIWNTSNIGTVSIKKD